MFDNIGGKIKALATFITVIGILVSIISGIIIMMLHSDLMLIAVLMMIVGSLLSWLSSFLLYGFGELIYRTTATEEKVQKLSVSLQVYVPTSHQENTENRNIIV